MGKIIVDPEDLEDSLMGISIGINTTLEEDITKPYSDCKAIGGFLWTLTDFFRSRGILIHLTDGDIHGFFEDMNRAALTYVTFLQAYYHDMDVYKEDYHGSLFYPIVCALVASNFELAEKIDRLMPKEMGIYDSEIHFSYTMIIRKLTAGTDEEIQQAFEIFEKECTGFLRYDHKIKFVKGLIEGDSDMFNHGVYEYLKSFDDISFEEAQEMDPGDETIDLESLAFIQLAKRKGLEIGIPHRMVPPELQEARLLIPDSGYPAWPE